MGFSHLLRTEAVLAYFRAKFAIPLMLMLQNEIRWPFWAMSLLSSKKWIIWPKANHGNMAMWSFLDLAMEFMDWWECCCDFSVYLLSFFMLLKDRRRHFLLLYQWCFPDESGMVFMEKPTVSITKVSFSETLVNNWLFVDHFAYEISLMEGFIAGKEPLTRWFAVDYTQWP